MMNSKKERKKVPNASSSKNIPVGKSKHFCGDCDGCKRQDCNKCSSCQGKTRKRICDYKICKKIHTMKYYNKNQYDMFVKRIGKIYECKFCKKKISTVRLVCDHFDKKHRKEIRSEKSKRKKNIKPKINEQNFKCSKCSQLFHLEKTLEGHMKEQHQKVIQKLPVIPTLTELRDSLHKYGLATYGDKDTLLARLQVHNKRIAKISEKSSSEVKVAKIQKQQNEPQKNRHESEKNLKAEIFVKEEIRDVETSKEQNNIEKLSNQKEIKKEPQDKIINSNSETSILSSSISSSQIEINDQQSSNSVKKSEIFSQNYSLLDDKNEIEEISLVKQLKTKVEILFKDNVYRIRISKSSITLDDIRKHLMSQPEKFGMSHNVNYDFSVKTIENGKIVIDEIDDDMNEDNLPLLDGKIVLNCWAKSL